MALIFDVDSSNPASYPGSGSSWFDLSGNGNNVTLYNSPTFTNVGGVKTLNFNGSNQYGQFSPTGLVYGTGPRSLALWVRYNDWVNANVGVALMYGNPANSQDIGLWAGPTAFYGASTNNDVTYNATVSLGRFYHMVVTYDGTTAKLYVNGELVASAAKSWNTISNTAYIARYTNGNYPAACSLGRASIYDEVLDATAVTSLYTAYALTFPTVVDAVSLLGFSRYGESQGPVSPDYLAATPVLLGVTTGGTPPTPVVPSHAGLPPVL